LKSLGASFDISSLKIRAAELQALYDNMRVFDKELAIAYHGIQKTLDEFKSFENIASDLSILLEMALEEDDESTLYDLNIDLKALTLKLEEFQLQHLFNDIDQNSAIVSINSGAGGQEAQDWSKILFRMYRRWAEKNGYVIDILNILINSGDGIKNVDFIVKGKYAYGYLKLESGVHRLVRNSPFDAKNSRHTSFSSVFVSPEINDRIEIDIKDSDLRIDTFCASGPGGQHVNKTESAVRITHIPTKIVVSCQNEKSQHSNHETAMKILRSRIYELELRKRQEELQELHDNMTDISWGHQIRSYFLQPKVIIKDHRTELERFDADSVLGGDINDFIRLALLNNKIK
jgi:peptide chain release factor 2